MGKNQAASGLTNIIQYDDRGNITFVSGSTTLMSVSSSGAIITTGTISGSDATNALLLNGTGSLAFTTTASYNAASASLSSRTTQVEKTYASTGSNTFTGAQFISDTSNAISFTSTASLYSDGGLRVQGNSFVSGTAYFNNIVVYGTSSVQYITSSQVNVGTNIITVNTDTPAVRFGGLAVFDSGSTQLTGSILWDSEKNHWVYSNPSGSSYSGGMLISGPRSSALGSEQGTTACMLLVGQGSDHLTSSMIYHDSARTCFYGTSLFVSSSGNIGLGLNNPTNKLEVQSGDIKVNAGASRCTSVFFGIIGTNYGKIQYSDMDGSMLITTMGVGSGYDLNLGTKCTTRLTILGDGNVGIGICAPKTRLQVTPSYNAEVPVLGCASGIVSFTSTNTNYGLQFNSTSDGTFHIQSQRFDGFSTAYDIVLNYAGGKVGIGKTPSAFLDITGGSDGDQMISIGSNSVSGILSTPSNLYINADSDNNSGTGQITFGFNRTGYSGGTPVLNILESCQVGLVILPSAWAAPFQVIQGGSNGQHVGFQTNGADMKLGTNNYYYGAGYKYTCSNYGAVQINVGASNAGGYFSVNSAPIGTGGTDVTFTERLAVTADGSVVIDAAGTGTRSYLIPGRFSNGLTNSGAAWLGRASDRPVGQMTVQLGSSDTRTFEVVDYLWSRVAFFVNGSGNYDFAGSDISDRRQKCNIQYIEDSQICTIMKLKSASFNKKNGVGGINDNVHTGFIAQDVLEANIPNLVHGKEEDGYGLDYNGILSLAVKAIQEQQCTIETLKTCLGIA